MAQELTLQVVCYGARLLSYFGLSAFLYVLTLSEVHDLLMSKLDNRLFSFTSS
ncbi:rCG30231 [Rattus norvegicus]|uniref:RCG30231 n=1 Tax=Rattus norvegicus TaxID=10116 RepID=A6ILT8_RAT|nr:rCG30231 [Rattus norvegicus]